ncbi:MAG: hypothetical protein Harvfovirus15_22 [Harvfovirus sp.]|uniref:Uncharacterized protein n=1 Tax=Harvfovirus sp. TaxID=2487768 RepID=A0A3G5A1I1_9VIRU|nr:MAG: hypothetical protein Harvfovirus15_22 [Harvfovirus sp.]
MAKRKAVDDGSTRQLKGPFGGVYLYNLDFENKEEKVTYCTVLHCKEIADHLCSSHWNGVECKMCCHSYIPKNRPDQFRKVCSTCLAKLPKYFLPDVHRGIIKGTLSIPSPITRKETKTPRKKPSSNEGNIGKTFLWQSGIVKDDPEAGTDFLGVIIGVDDIDYRVCYIFLGKYGALGYKTQKCKYPPKIQCYISLEFIDEVNPRLLHSSLIPIRDGNVMPFSKISESNIRNIMWMDPEEKALTAFHEKLACSERLPISPSDGAIDDLFLDAIKHLPHPVKGGILKTSPSSLITLLQTEAKISPQNITLANPTAHGYKQLAKFAANFMLSADNFKSYVKYLFETRTKINFIFFEADLTSYKENLKQLFFQKTVFAEKFVLAMTLNETATTDFIPRLAHSHNYFLQKYSSDKASQFHCFVFYRNQP